MFSFVLVFEDLLLVSLFDTVQKQGEKWRGKQAKPVDWIMPTLLQIPISAAKFWVFPFLNSCCLKFLEHRDYVHL